MGVKDEEYEIQTTFQLFSFSFIYDFSGVKAEGDHIETLMRGYISLMYKDFDSLKMDSSKRIRKKYRIGQITQYYGLGKKTSTGKEMVMIYSYFKHKQNTYCIVMTVPKKNYNKKCRRRVRQLLNGMQKL